MKIYQNYNGASVLSRTTLHLTLVYLFCWVWLGPPTLYFSFNILDRLDSVVDD